MTTTILTQLHAVLQKALEVELFTIPPYLTALYSINDGTNTAAVKIIQGVVMEEMLHAALVSNLLNAVGGDPCLRSDKTNRLKHQQYPAQFPHIQRTLSVGLLPFGKPAVDVFMDIELPESRLTWGSAKAVLSIGQLYDRVRTLLITATEELGARRVFPVSARARQLSSADYYGSGGTLTPVVDLASALAAIDEISQQGEGRVHNNTTGDDARFDQPKEVAHYYRFNQILEGRYYDRDDDVAVPTGPRLVVDWDAVKPVGTSSPYNSSGRPPGIEKLLENFTASYEALLNDLHLAFNGKKDALAGAIPIMHGLKYQAMELMRITDGDGKACPPPFFFLRS